MIPAYVRDLRAKVGNDLLWLPGVTAIVLRESATGPEILLQHRSDTDVWNPLCGSIDPGEDPDACAIREVREEAGIDITVERLLWVQALPARTLPNGHRTQYYDTALLCRPVGSGDQAHVADDESRAIEWTSVDALPPMEERFLAEIRLALSDDPRPRLGLDGRRA